MKEIKLKNGTENIFGRYLDIKDYSQKEKFLMEIFGQFIEVYCVRQPVCLRDVLRCLEKSIIAGILSKVNGNQKEASTILGIKYTTLNEKIKRYNIGFKRIPSG